jgi:hypothetical protein
MTIHYLPNVGFRIESQEIKWGEKRDSIRKILKKEFQQDDGTIDNSPFFDGDTSYNIIYRRDLYKNFKTTYDKDDCLTELEVHQEADVLVSGITLMFGKDISEFINQFKKLNNNPTVVNEGEYFFESLKMVIATSQSMGGEGNGLDYFYVGKDVSHVIEEYNEIIKGSV